MGHLISKTVPDGEAWAAYEATGEVRVIEGPARVSRLGCACRELRRCDVALATESQYLKVQFRDGRCEVRPGPYRQVVHPVEHASVTCEAALPLRSEEVVVFYRQEATGEGAAGQGETRRHLLRGPGLYVPQTASEWIHEFRWTGPDNAADSMERARKKVGALHFKTLRVIPAKMYFDVENVRTKDNALITVKLMIFYQLKDIDRMLDNTNDPMGDFVNAVSADVIEWCAPKKFDEFLEATDQLNTLEPYTQLKQSGLNIGYNIDRVVFRGYTAPMALQRMHDSAIERRTALTLQKETEAEEQSMADFRLTKESERAARQQKLEMDKLSHDIAMKEKTADAEAVRRRQEHALELQRLTDIKKLDKNGELVQYLMAKDCQLPSVVNCATMLAGGSGTPGGSISLPGFRT